MSQYKEKHLRTLFDSCHLQEMHDLSKDPAHQEELVSWRRRLIQELADRPEGFSDGTKLIAGKEPVRASEAMMALGKQRISEGFTLAFGKKNWISAVRMYFLSVDLWI